MSLVTDVVHRANESESEAFDGAEALSANVLRKARFREMMAGQPLNERQRKGHQASAGRSRR